jgi:hypothetical protein
MNGSDIEQLVNLFISPRHFAFRPFPPLSWLLAQNIVVDGEKWPSTPSLHLDCYNDTGTNHCLISLV